MSKNEQRKNSSFKAVFVVCLLCIISAVLIVFSHNVFLKKQHSLCEEFEKKYKLIKNGDTKEKVAKILGEPTEIIVLPIMAPCLYKNIDCISGATLGTTDIEIWHYEILKKIYSIYFELESDSNKWVVYAKKHPEKS